MMNRELLSLPVHMLSALLHRRELSSLELTKAYLSSVEEKEECIRAYISVTKDEALFAASEADARLANGETAPLLGIPFALKDNISTRGIRTTAASRMLEEFIPPYDATVTERLKKQGAVLLGKTNLDEFAMGSTTEMSFFFPTRNPHDLTRVPGGSSGGSAAAVAAKETAFALGSDTGGSIRQPAAFCGVVGLKPTFGSVSRYGMIAFASSLDQIGPITRCVEDAALVYDAIAGSDPRDFTCTHSPSPTHSSVKKGVHGLKIGLPKEFFGDFVSPEIREATLNAASLLEALGAHVEETSLPSFSDALKVYCILASAEASSNLARFDGIKFGHQAKNAKTPEELFAKSRGEGFGREVKRRILMGTFALSQGHADAFYETALSARTACTRELFSLTSKFDALLTPTTPTTAFPFHTNENDPVAAYGADILTAPASIAGAPALSLPFGTDKNNLPIGIQLIGGNLSENILFRIGYACETGVKEGA